MRKWQKLPVEQAFPDPGARNIKPFLAGGLKDGQISEGAGRDDISPVAADAGDLGPWLNGA